MADENFGQDRQMFQGDWTCSGCGAKITELPFQPDPEREDQLLCRDCHSKKRQERGGDRRERKMYTGSWTCADCGTTITELPFNPDPAKSDNLLCRDCHKKKKGF